MTDPNTPPVGWLLQLFFDGYGDGCAAFETGFDTIEALTAYLGELDSEADAILIRRGPAVELGGQHEGCIGPYRLERGEVSR